MVGFGYGDVAHDRGDLRKAFLLGDPGEGGVHFGVLVPFAGRGSDQVALRPGDHAGGKRGLDLHVAAFKELEETFGVFLFLCGRFRKDVGNLDKPFLFGRAAEIILAVARLGFAGKRGEEIDFRSRALQRLHTLSIVRVKAS